jgi:hypothetical protein
MPNHFEGNGFLFREDRLIAPVRYRLQWGLDDTGHSRTEGELWMRPGNRLTDYGDGPFRLHTGAGFSVPVEVTQPTGDGWLAFRRIARQQRSAEDGLG